MGKWSGLGTNYQRSRPLLLAIDLWWDAKTRTPSHAPRKQYKKRASRGEALETPTSDTDSNEEEEEDKLLLNDWDEWMQDD